LNGTCVGAKGEEGGEVLGEVGLGRAVEVVGGVPGGEGKFLGANPGRASVVHRARRMEVDVRKGRRGMSVKREEKELGVRRNPPVLFLALEETGSEGVSGRISGKPEREERNEQPTTHTDTPTSSHSKKKSLLAPTSHTALSHLFRQSPLRPPW